MALAAAIHNLSVQQQHTLKSTDGTVSFYLDNGNLLIKPKSAPYPYPLSAVDTLALANMLKIFYADIAEEAKKYNGNKTAGRKDEW